MDFLSSCSTSSYNGPCNSIIAFQELDSTSQGFLSNYMGDQFIKALPTLKFRSAIAVGKAFRSTMPMIFEVPNITEEEFAPSEKFIKETQEVVTIKKSLKQ